MDRFYKRKLSKEDIDPKDTGIFVRDVLKLIETSPYREELITLFEVDTIKDEVIKIPGANTLVKGIIAKDEEFQKFDIQTSVGNIVCNEINDDTSIELEFANIVDIETLKITDSNKISTTTIYSSKSDFFEGLYKIDKYANYCVKEGNKDLIKQNLDILKNLYKSERSHDRSYRIIKDNKGVFFLRAITSINNYRDYNVRFSVFIALIALHREMKSSGDNYKVYSCEYNESNLRLYFEKEGFKKVDGLGNVQFLLEIVNDEIKRDAMRFSGLNLISLPKSDVVIVKPKSFRSSIVSIKHNIKPKTVFEQLSFLTKINKVQNELFEDLSKIKNAKNPDELRYVLYQKIKDIKQDVLKEFKTSITPIVQSKITSILQLLEMMKRVDDLVTDLDAKEYLKYIFYDVLTGGKS